MPSFASSPSSSCRATSQRDVSPSTGAHEALAFLDVDELRRNARTVQDFDAATTLAGAPRPSSAAVPPAGSPPVPSPERAAAVADAFLAAADFFLLFFLALAFFLAAGSTLAAAFAAALVAWPCQAPLLAPRLARPAKRQDVPFIASQALSQRAARLRMRRSSAGEVSASA